MWWEWLCSLFPASDKTDVDPYVWRCLHCGFKWKFSRFEQLKMFLSSDYIHTCPQCQYQSRYRMIKHIVRETDTDEIRENNKWID